VAYDSTASDLVAGDTNGFSDVFVRDRTTGTSLLASRTVTTQSNGPSSEPSIEANGGSVVFSSLATSFDEPDTNAFSDIYLRTLPPSALSPVVLRVTNEDFGGETNGPSMAPFVPERPNEIVFTSDASNLVLTDTNRRRDAFVSATDGGNERVSTAAGFGADRAALSGDGRFVAFTSPSPDLVADDTNETVDAFLRDEASGTVERLSVSSTGAEANDHVFDLEISSDARYAVFYTYATNLVANPPPEAGWYLRDRTTATTRLLAIGLSPWARLAPSGAFVAFVDDDTLSPDDANPGFADVYVYDIANDSYRLASRPTDPDPYAFLGSDLSSDGRFVVFESGAFFLEPVPPNHNSTDIFLADSISGQQSRLSAAPSETRFSVVGDPTISDDGNTIAWFATREDDQTTDLYLYDRLTATRVNLSGLVAGGVDFATLGPVSMSSDGTVLAFTTPAALVPADNNDAADSYIWDRTSGEFVRTSLGALGQEDEYGAASAALSGDGRLAAFVSASPRFTNGDFNNGLDVFVAPTRRIDLESSSAVHAEPGSSATVTVTARGLDAGATAISDDAEVTVTGVEAAGTDSIEIAVQIGLAAQTGPHSLLVIAAGPPWDPTFTSSDLCGGCLIVD